MLTQRWRQIIPTLFTLTAMVAGLFSILQACSGNYVLSAKLIMLAMMLDGLDGFVARKLNGTTTFGAELDTFVDLVSFGVAPAVLVYQITLKDFGLLGLIIVSSIVISGALRLSRFKVINQGHGQQGYFGLPITIVAGLIALAVMLTQSDFLNTETLNLSKGYFAIFIWCNVIICVILQVSNIRYQKPTTKLIVFVPIMLLILCLFLKADFSFVAILTFLIIGEIYVFVTPFLPFVIKQLKRKN